MSERFLIDNSALQRWRRPRVAEVLDPLHEDGVLAVCGPVEMEVMYSARNETDAKRLHWFLSGFDYNPSANHPGIDIDGEEGDPVYAADSGVVVYAGWNDWGYGNVVVINHGNGWQTLYAHLSTFYVGCGQSVIQGGVIAAFGSTGNATGSHLHFEMMFEGTRADPDDYLP